MRAFCSRPIPGWTANAFSGFHQHQPWGTDEGAEEDGGVPAFVVNLGKLLTGHLTCQNPNKMPTAGSH